jgi:3',5'-cyclic AMP phosphodiesterase CpdA
MTGREPPPRRSFIGPSLVLVAAIVLLAIAALAARQPGSGVSVPSPTPDAVAASAGASPTVEPVASPSGSTRAPEVLLGAGDIVECQREADEATAALLDTQPGTVFTLGDNVYELGTPEEFASCYDPSWGRHRERTRFPVAGNHDWGTPNTAGYREYFGAAATPEGTTWYSHDVGAWHVVVLDSNCELVGGCDEGSPQLEWLREDLAASDARCTLALWHHPRFSSGGRHGNDTRVDSLWRTMHAAGAEVILNGHDHNYERFAPQDGEGSADPATGLRLFIAGTGGTDLRPMAETKPNSEVRDDDTHGILRLELHSEGYAWEFLPIAGQSFTDAGTGTCH